MMKNISVALALIIVVFVTACGFLPRKVKVGEEFTLHSGEKVSVSGADLTIEIKSIGRQWYVDRRAESGYAELMTRRFRTAKSWRGRDCRRRRLHHQS